MRLLLILCLTLTCCAPSRNLCERSYGPCGMVYPDSVYLTRTITLPPTRVSDTLWQHTFSTDTLAYLRTDTVIITDQTRSTRLKRWYDTQLRAYRIECESLKRDTIWRESVSINKPEARTPRDDRPLGVPMWAFYVMTAAIAVLLLALMFKR